MEPVVVAGRPEPAPGEQRREQPGQAALGPRGAAAARGPRVCAPHQRVGEGDQAAVQPGARAGRARQRGDEDRLSRRTGLGQHRGALAGHDEGVGQRQIAEVGIAVGVLPRPAEDVRRAGQLALEGARRRARRAPARGREEGAAGGLGKGSAAARQLPGLARGEPRLWGVAADHQGDPGTRRALEERRPALRRALQRLRSHPRDREVGDQLARMGQQPRVARSHGEVVGLAGRDADAPELDEPRAPPRLAADPAGGRRRATARGDHQIRPRGPEAGGGATRDAAQPDSQPGVGQVREQAGLQVEDLVGPAQLLRQAERLGRVAGLAIGQHPDPGQGIARKAAAAAMLPAPAGEALPRGEQQLPVELRVAARGGLEVLRPPLRRVDRAHRRTQPAARGPGSAGQGGEDEAAGAAEERLHGPGDVVRRQVPEALENGDGPAGRLRLLLQGLAQRLEAKLPGAELRELGGLDPGSGAQQAQALGLGARDQLAQARLDLGSPPGSSARGWDVAREPAKGGAGATAIEELESLGAGLALQIQPERS